MMVSTGESSLASSHIQQITPKSKWSISTAVVLVRMREYFLTGSHTRVLLATIRDKGNCLCPRCLTMKADFDRLGFLSDASWRISKARTYIRKKIAMARAAIYNLGSPIKDTIPEAHLKNMSLVPTFVSLSEFQQAHIRSSGLNRIWLQIVSDHLDAIFIACLWSIFSTNLN